MSNITNTSKTNKDLGENAENARNAKRAEAAGSKAIAERFNLSHAVSLPAVVDQLPDLLQKGAQCFDLKRERDVFLLSTLPVLAGCMPNIRGKYGHEVYSPDLYIAVIAPAASGKGIARFGRRIGKQVDELIREGSNGEQMIDTPDLSSGEVKSLFVPGNASARAFFDAIETRDGRGVVFETEIDTLATILQQEWAQFENLIRAAFHHEHWSLTRVGDENSQRDELHIAKPRLSVFLSGTPNQFKRLIPSIESGLYSRFGIFYLTGTDDWVSQRPLERGPSIQNEIDDLASTVRELYRALRSREHPIPFVLYEHQWNCLDELFRSMHEEIQGLGVPELSSIPKRAALMAFRISMILSVLRCHSNGDNLAETNQGIVPTEADMDTAMRLASALADHSLRFSRKLHHSGKLEGFSSERPKKFYRELPDEFEKANAVEIGEDLGIPDRTVGDYLSKFVGEEILRRVKQGHYEKV